MAISLRRGRHTDGHLILIADGAASAAAGPGSACMTCSGLGVHQTTHGSGRLHRSLAAASQASTDGVRHGGHRARSRSQPDADLPLATAQMPKSHAAGRAGLAHSNCDRKCRRGTLSRWCAYALLTRYSGTTRPSRSVTVRSIRAASSGLCVAISAATPCCAHHAQQFLEHRPPPCRHPGCRWARRPAARAAHWPAPARSPRAAARRPTACPAGGRSRAPSPNASSSARARRSAARAAAAGDHLRQHDVLQRGELAEQMMELVDEADRVAADRGALAHRPARRHRGRRRTRGRHPASPAVRRGAAASICRCRTARPAPRSRRPATPGRRRAAPAGRRRRCDRSARRRAVPAGRRSVTHGAAPRPDRCAPPASSDTAWPAATAPAPCRPPAPPRATARTAGRRERK